MSTRVTTGHTLSLTCTLANTLYSITLPPNTQKLALQAVGNDVKFRFVTGGAVFTVKATVAPLKFDDLTIGPNGLEVWAESANAGAVLELLVWT